MKTRKIVSARLKRKREGQKERERGRGEREGVRVCVLHEFGEKESSCVQEREIEKQVK